MSSAAALPAPADIAVAARALVAEAGLRGLSLRKVAARAGVSLGGLSYQIGAKGDLLGELVRQAVEEQRRLHDGWRMRIARTGVDDPAMLALVITGYLDDLACCHREHALALCELLLEAARAQGGLPGAEVLVREEAAFWRAALKEAVGGGDLAEAVAGYLRDELPFNLALAHEPDYRLLRGVVCAELAAGLRAMPGVGGAGPFEALVESLESGAFDLAAPVAADPDSRRARLASVVALLISEQGVAAVTHRSVAAAAGAPNSTVAHHFRRREDLLRAGLQALYVDATRAPVPGDRPGFSILAATHAMALQAARDPTLAPFARDLRRRRGQRMADLLIPLGALTGASAQAAAMALTGASVASQVDSGGEAGGPLMERLARLTRRPPAR